MESKSICPLCSAEFTRNDNMKRHMNKHLDGTYKNKEPKKYVCDICNKAFSRRYNMQIHQTTIHPSIKDHTYQTLVSKISELSAELKEIKSGQQTISQELQKNTPNNIINNQILNVICVTNHDNYLDMLTDRLGDFNQAIEYIKDCAFLILPMTAN